MVPADFVKKSGSHHVYDIPDCEGGWMKASPEAHTAYVAQVDKKLGGKVRPAHPVHQGMEVLPERPLSHRSTLSSG